MRTSVHQDNQRIYKGLKGQHVKLRGRSRNRKQQNGLNDELRPRIYENLEDLENLRSDWEALLSQFPCTTSFSTLEWLIPWWRAFGSDDRLQVVAFRDALESLVGVAPLALGEERSFGSKLRLLRLMGDGSHDSDNLDLPVRPAFEGKLSRALIRWLDDHRRDWDICRLSTLPAESLVGNCLLKDLKEYGWKPFLSTRPWTVIDLPESWELYLKIISSKERGKIGLRTRRLEKRCNVRIRKCTAASELNCALEALFELHKKHWQLRGLPGTLHMPARQKFYHECARQLLAKRRLEFWVLELEGRIVAAQLGLRHENVVFSLQEGFDPEYSSDSVGYVLRAHVLKCLIADGVRRYDFLGGKEDSKLRWGAQVKHYINIEFARPFSRGSLHLLFQYKSAELKGRLRKRLPGRVWAFLKAHR